MLKTVLDDIFNDSDYKSENNEIPYRGGKMNYRSNKETGSTQYRMSIWLHRASGQEETKIPSGNSTVINSSKHMDS